jgi:hypothetical protein
MVNSRTLVVSGTAGIFVSILTMALLFALPANTWERWQPATCLTTNCFCETIEYGSPVRQAVNAWSSLAFVFSGVFVIATSRRMSASGGRLPGNYAGIIGIASIVTGVGSAFYHASLTFTGQFFDVFGMYLLASLMLVYALERLRGWGTWKTLALYLILNVFLTTLQIAIPESRRYAFAIVLVMALVCEYGYQVSQRPRVQDSWLNAGVGLFAAAYIIWILDNTGTLCDPYSLVQGHAAWHVLGAIAVGFLYTYYASERKR